MRFERVGKFPLGEIQDNGRPVIPQNPTRVQGATTLGYLRHEVRQLLVTSEASTYHQNRRTGTGRERAGYQRALRDILRLIAKFEAEGA